MEYPYLGRPSDHERAIVAAVQALPDDELIALVVNSVQRDAYPIELQRRLVVALKDFKLSSDRASDRLLWATAILIVLTAAIIFLTVVLIAQA